MFKIDSYDFKGKRAIVRVDFNVPLDENGKITDDTRIRGALPTLKKVLADGGSLVIMSHMGKPKGKVNPKFSLSQIVDAVSEKLGVPVKFAPDCAKAAEAAAAGELCLGTIDAWVVWTLTGGTEFRCDWSNASRTQLFDLRHGCWSEPVCEAFGVDVACLPQVTDSDGLFGTTDLGGFLPAPVPVHGVLGDSHAALFAQGCHNRGMAKATYGTGSSVMMNVGDEFVASSHGLSSSLAWRMDGVTQLGDFSDYTTVYRTLDNAVQLSDDGSVYVEPEVPEPGEPQPTQEERIKALEDQNETLLQCILEMSEIVYA